MRWIQLRPRTNRPGVGLASVVSSALVFTAVSLTGISLGSASSSTGCAVGVSGSPYAASRTTRLVPAAMPVRARCRPYGPLRQA